MDWDIVWAIVDIIIVILLVFGLIYLINKQVEFNKKWRNRLWESNR